MKLTEGFLLFCVDTVLYWLVLNQMDLVAVEIQLQSTWLSSWLWFPCVL